LSSSSSVGSQVSSLSPTSGYTAPHLMQLRRPSMMGSPQRGQVDSLISFPSSSCALVRATAFQDRDREGGARLARDSRSVVGWRRQSGSLRTKISPSCALDEAPTQPSQSVGPGSLFGTPNLCSRNCAASNVGASTRPISNRLSSRPRLSMPQGRRAKTTKTATAIAKRPKPGPFH
jgi:hypothetical protein